MLNGTRKDNSIPEEIIDKIEKLLYDTILQGFDFAIETNNEVNKVLSKLLK